LLDKYGDRFLYEERADIYGCCIKLLTDVKYVKERWEESFYPMSAHVRSHGRLIVTNDENEGQGVLYDPLSKTAILYLTGMTPALSESTLKASKKAVECAKNHGCKLSFDTNIRPLLWRSAEEAAKTLLLFVEQADILFTDLANTMILLGEKDADKAIESYLSMGVEIVIFKLGAKGTIAALKGERVMARGYRVPVVDTIGAGMPWLEHF